jgi:hypothetical protein
MSLELTLYRVLETEISQLIFNLEQEGFEKNLVSFVVTVQGGYEVSAFQALDCP